MTCDCGRPDGQCIKGDMPECPAWNEDEADDDYDEGMDCGRWDQNAKNGMLPRGLCRLAGTEWCDWECPHSRR